MKKPRRHRRDDCDTLDGELMLYPLTTAFSTASYATFLQRVKENLESYELNTIVVKTILQLLPQALFEGTLGRARQQTRRSSGLSNLFWRKAAILIAAEQIRKAIQDEAVI